MGRVEPGAGVDSVAPPGLDLQTPEVSELMDVFADAASQARGLVQQRKSLDLLGERAPQDLRDGWSRDAALTLSRMADAFDLLRASCREGDAPDEQPRDRMRG